MTSSPTAGGPAAGLDLESCIRYMTLDTALTAAVGDVMVVKQDGTMSVIKVPATADLQYGTFCVCLQAQTVAAGVVLVGFRGKFDFVKLEGTTDIALTDPLIAVDAQRYLVDGAASTACDKVLGWATAAYTTNAVALKTVWFDGLTGFGHVI